MDHRPINVRLGIWDLYVMKLWDLYYWNKHEYCWKWLQLVYGDTPQSAIKVAKSLFQMEAVLKVERLISD